MASLPRTDNGIHDRNEKTEGFARSRPRGDNETLSRLRFGEGLPLVPRCFRHQVW